MLLLIQIILHDSEAGFTKQELQNWMRALRISVFGVEQRVNGL